MVGLAGRYFLSTDAGSGGPSLGHFSRAHGPLAPIGVGKKLSVAGVRSPPGSPQGGGTMGLCCKPLSLAVTRERWV